jgi:hypothetical protein
MAAFSRQDGFYVGAASAPNTGDGNPPSDQRPPPKMVGGPCEYKTYTGRAEIISVRLIALPKGHPGPPHENYEVKFIFFPNQRIDESYAQVENKPQLLTLTNSWYPGPRFLEKYGIAEGKTFDCRLKVITRGTCTPVVFTFPEIDLGDYFESRSSEERR